MAAGGDFIGVTCLTTFTAGSGPGNSSTPACSIIINNDLLVEQDETFSLNASIQNGNGQSVQFSAGGDSASATITDDDGMLVQLLSVVYTYFILVITKQQLHNFLQTFMPQNPHTTVQGLGVATFLDILTEMQ